MPEIRLDVRLLRPGALVAGVAGGRCVLVRAVADAGAGAPWIAAREAGWPVPEVRETRCGERRVLVVPRVVGQPLAPAVAGAALAQAAALGGGLAACGIAVSRIAASDLHVCDGLLTVRAPVVGPADAADETAAFAAMVATACAPTGPAAAPRRRRALPVAIAGVAALAVVVTLVPWRSPSAAPPARAATPPVARVVPAPEVVPTVAEVAVPKPAPARLRKPKRHHAKAVPAVPRRRRAPKVAPPVAKPPARHRAPAPPGGEVPVAGGEADPLPAR